MLNCFYYATPVKLTFKNVLNGADIEKECVDPNPDPAKDTECCEPDDTTCCPPIQVIFTFKWTCYYPPTKRPDDDPGGPTNGGGDPPTTGGAGGIGKRYDCVAAGIGPKYPCYPNGRPCDAAAAAAIGDTCPCECNLIHRKCRVTLTGTLSKQQCMNFCKDITDKDCGQPGGGGGGGGVIVGEGEGEGGVAPKSKYGRIQRRTPDPGKVPGLQPIQNPQSPQNILPTKSKRSSGNFGGGLLGRVIQPKVNLKENPQGPFDQDIGIMVPDSTPIGATEAPNNLPVSHLFAPTINRGIDYILNNNKVFSNWSNLPSFEINQDSFSKSLDPSLLKSLKKLRKIDGSLLNSREIFEIFKTRLFEGILLDEDQGIKPLSLKRLSRETQETEFIRIKKSSNKNVNQMKALALLENTSIPADPSNVEGTAHNTVMNYNILGPDIDASIPISINGQIKPLYVTDAGTISQYKTLTMQDGYYFAVKGGKRLLCDTELDHTIINNEPEVQKAIKLLGGTGERTLSVSAAVTDRLEITNNLNLSGEDPRPDVIFAKIILSSVVTTSTNKPLLYETKASYEVMDSSSASGIANINEYIKHKVNHRVFFMSYDDVFLDYVLFKKSFNISQEDVLYEDSKTNKNIPNLVRRIPFYVLIFPTNRQRYMPTSQQSNIITLDNERNIVERHIKMAPSLEPDLYNGGGFIKEKSGWLNDSPIDVFGKSNVQNKISTFDPTETLYTEGYSVGRIITNGSLAKRTKKVFRLLYDIIVGTLDKNYVLSRKGLSPSVYWFDILSRFTLTEYNRFIFLSNSNYLSDKLKNGFFKKIRILSPIKFSGKEQLFKTTIVRRKSVEEAAASTDFFPQVKNTRRGERIDISEEGVSLGRGGLSDTQVQEAREGRTRSSVDL